MKAEGFDGNCTMDIRETFRSTPSPPGEVRMDTSVSLRPLIGGVELGLFGSFCCSGQSDRMTAIFVSITA